MVLGVLDMLRHGNRLEPMEWMRMDDPFDGLQRLMIHSHRHVRGPNSNYVTIA
jgi:hypothetical protein